MDNLQYYEMLKEKIKKDNWIEQSCGEIYILSSVGTNFYKDREIIHLSMGIEVDEEKLERLKEI